jgi:hypothetical protein
VFLVPDALQEQGSRKAAIQKVIAVVAGMAILCAVGGWGCEAILDIGRWTEASCITYNGIWGPQQVTSPTLLLESGDTHPVAAGVCEPACRIATPMRCGRLQTTSFPEGSMSAPGEVKPGAQIQVR